MFLVFLEVVISVLLFAAAIAIHRALSKRLIARFPRFPLGVKLCVGAVLSVALVSAVVVIQGLTGLHPMETH